jgi:hypothetical protein
MTAGWVAVDARKHDSSTYGNQGCRCGVCRASHNAYVRRARLRRAARRVLVDGRLVAPVPAERHGRPSTYVNWRCQCLPCLKAHNVETCDGQRRPATATTQGERGGMRTSTAFTHGLNSGYSHYGCRCGPCRVAHAAAWRRMREVRLASRVRVSGRWVAPLPASRHGLINTYVYHGCRCETCTETNRLRARRYA